MPHSPLTWENMPTPLEAVEINQAIGFLSDPLKFANTVTRETWHWKSIDPWQSELFLSKKRYIHTTASRQSGKSSILMVKALYQALVKPNSLVLIVAEQRQSNEDIRKAKQLLTALGKYLRKRFGGSVTVGVLTDNITSVEFSHGSRIIALPANEKVRGYSAPDMVIIDEAAYLPDEVFVGLDPMLEVSQGQLIVASTPNGTQGFFYRESHNPRYQKFRIPWQQCPRISSESIYQKRILYGEAYVQQEYECQYLDEITALFTERSLRASFDDDEDTFSEQFSKINNIVQGNVELI